jgi:hypothetical protein
MCFYFALLTLLLRELRYLNLQRNYTVALSTFRFSHLAPFPPAPKAQAAPQATPSPSAQAQSAYAAQRTKPEGFEAKRTKTFGFEKAKRTKPPTFGRVLKQSASSKIED